MKHIAKITGRDGFDLNNSNDFALIDAHVTGARLSQQVNRYFE